MKLNLKLYFLLIVVFCCKIVTAQTLSLNDLINLQKSDYNKAKGFFQYKGFSSNGSKINDQDAVVKDNYQLTYNWYCWSYRPFNIWYIYKIGYENVLVYTVNETDYYALENSVKSQYKKQESTSCGRESGNCYRGF
ncbi:MAG: hypothetical protein NTX03_09230 [Bacteroidetes bacterium]|nr:hypothetical protein [Bacteroidota bacterium]